MATENFTLFLYFVVYTDQQNRPDEQVSKVSKVFLFLSVQTHIPKERQKINNKTSRKKKRMKKKKKKTKTKWTSESNYHCTGACWRCNAARWRRMVYKAPIRPSNAAMRYKSQDESKSSVVVVWSVLAFVVVLAVFVLVVAVVVVVVVAAESVEEEKNTERSFSQNNSRLSLRRTMVTGKWASALVSAAIS